MRIALVSPYDCSRPGGVCVHIAGLRREFTRAGHEVTVIAPRATGGGLTATAGRIEVGRAITVRGNGSRARLTFDLGRYRALRAVMAERRFDIVHVHEPFMPLLPIMALHASATVNVATFHTFRPRSPWYALFRPYLSAVAARVHRRIAVSEAAKALAERYFPGAYETIPNGIDERFAHGAVHVQVGGDVPRRVLFVGRFDEPRKGFRFLLDAMVAVRRRVPGAELVVAGEGDPRRWDAGLPSGTDAVRFLGPVPDAELRRLYRSCDVFCAPSVGSESFGLVLLEAMASGTPVVATAIPGYRELVTDGREGLVVGPRNADALAAALVRVLDNRELADSLGRAGMATAAAYALPLVAQRVLDVYREARTEHAADAS